MPYRSVRGVNRGVQDEEELQRIRNKEKQKKREKAKKWCFMIGMTVLEFVLCLICFAFGYYYYHSVEAYRNAKGIKHHPKSVRFILLPPTPLTVASVYLTITYVDLVSWHSLRPITYFGWIMVASSGFLMFLLYAGVIILSTNDLISMIAIFFGCITAFVFLADLICMMISLKRFPVPYWIMKRKYDKIDQCVCTGDYDPEDEEVERPICRCGDHWGEPCTCDDENPTCGCAVDKRGKAPCDCCECANQGRVADDTDAYGSAYDVTTLVSTMSGQDYIEEKRKSMLVQASLPMDEYCMSGTAGMYCIDGPRQIMNPVTRSTLAKDPYSLQSPSTCHSTSVRPSHSSAIPSKSSYSQKGGSSASRTAAPSIAPSSRITAPSMAGQNRLNTQPRMMTTPSRVVNPSITNSNRMGQTVNANRVSTVVRGVGGLTAPSLAQAAKIGGFNAELTENLGVPSMAMASRVAVTKSQRSVLSRDRSELAYSVYTTTVDDVENIRQTIASKYDGGKKSPNSIFRDRKGRTVQMISKTSSEEEVGEGDYPRNGRHTCRAAHKGHHKQKKIKSDEIGAPPQMEIGYMSDPEVVQGPTRLLTLPGQVSSWDDSQAYRSYTTKKNVSVSAKERSSRRLLRSPSTIRSSSESIRPRTSMDMMGGSRIIRNVSTTVRAVRTLSRVMEADNESRSDVNYRESDGFPSDSTITIKK